MIKAMRVVTVAICVGIICSPVCSSTANQFAPPSDEKLSVMTVDDTNKVYVTGKNLIYKLSANLSQLMNVTVPSDSSVRDVRVRGLSVSNGGQYIVACLTTGRCIGYDVINLNATNSEIPLNQPLEGVLVFTGNDPVVIFPGDAVGIIHTGTAIVGGTPVMYRMSLGQYSVSSGSIMADTTRDYTLITSRADFSTRTFKAGFTIDNFIYYIVEDDGQRIRVLRVCNSTTDTFQGLYEVLLECGGITVFSGASILPYSTNTLILTVRSAGIGTRSGRVCTYDISDINTAMENGRIICAATDNRENRETVWAMDTGFQDDVYQAICSASTACSLMTTISNTTFSIVAIKGDPVASLPVIEEINNQFNEFTSSVIVQVEEKMLIFIGTSNGRLLKYIFVNQSFSNPVRYNTTSITNTSITSLQWSLGSDYVYGLTSRQVIAIPVEDCESFRDCTSCSGLGDPLCGWCSIEDKCSRRSECSNNDETRRWIQDQDICLVNFAISPTTHPVEVTDQQFTITADQLPPPLDDESYYCVFGDVGSSLLEGDLIPDVTFTGLTCNYSFIVEQLSNGSDDTAMVDFSLRSNLTNINFITIDDGFTFFNCSTHASCHYCLSSNNLCGWCLYDKKCTSSSDRCRQSTDWINNDNSSDTSCPLILSGSRLNEYQQPVGALRNLSLNAINLPAPNENYTYQCVISYNGLESRIQAEYTGPNNSLVCVPRENDFKEFLFVDNARVSVLWTGPNVMYNLETEVDPLTVRLYNCTSYNIIFPGGCSSCLFAANLVSVDCGWCHDSGSCVVTESCSASWINIDTSCPQILSHTITNGVSDYQQPVGVLRNLSLNAINLPAPNGNYTYQCVISYNGLEFRIQAEYAGPNNGLVCVPRVNDFEEVEYVDNARVSVLWTGPNVMYNLENRQTVILYNCTALAGGCSSCLSVTNLLSLDCGWCHDSGSCVINESCSASSSFTTNSSGTCPPPQITMINPNSGPYQGGTTITITGTDLGVVVQDIISVTIGGVLCVIDSDSYQPIGFNCTSGESSARSYVSVIIAVNRSEIMLSANLPGGFRYAEVTITDFTPARIPQSGNITINIYGNNFNISNPALTEIRVAETLCEINQETLTSTYVQCIAGSRSNRGSGPVILLIDNSTTKSVVHFAYTDDPQIFSMRPNNVIRSGGIMMRFSGRDLDVVPTVLVIDVVDVVANNSVLEMPFNINCIAESEGELGCIFPEISNDDVDDIITGTLELRYSLVAASVPGLDNLHLMPQFTIEFVNDSIIYNLSGIIVYEKGSNTPITVRGKDLDGAVEKSEVQVIVGNGSCDIISYESNLLTCIPPQNGDGTVDIMVYIGKNLNYTIGSLRYSESNNTSNNGSNTTTILIVIITVTAVLVILLIIIIISYWIVKRKSKKHKLACTVNTDVNMYSSPAYGTHHVFSEPGMEHLYEPIDELGIEISTTFQEAATVTVDDKETDVDGYFKIKSSCKADDKSITESNTQCNTGNNNDISDEDYVQAADDLHTDTNDEDDGCKNDDQKNEYLQLQIDDHKEDEDLK